ncbi:MAG: Plug domain-containing protein, partial [Bacteroidia bacterium]|nr:Plug domain-containing protein [Bacteroidia bacterium]
MLNAQEQSDERLPLTFILSEVEDKYNIRFSFGDKTVENIVCKRPNYTNTLEEVIFSLKACSNLSFEILNDRFIVVTSTTAESPEMKVERLNEVVIENYLTRGLSKNVDGKIRIATQDFNILPGLTEPDILQTIQSLPGVISVDERISNINIRGGTNDQNLILFEGIKMYQSGHFFGLISAFYPYLAEETNVSKNGTSAKYGDGVSGVIT